MNCFQWNYIIDGISIHALRGEGDEYPYYIAYSDFRFQSTPSVGRATIVNLDIKSVVALFQSTPSVGRATFKAL